MRRVCNRTEGARVGDSDANAGVREVSQNFLSRTALNIFEGLGQNALLRNL